MLAHTSDDLTSHIPSRVGAPAVVTRFAPSPTGLQHIGGIRTALYAYLWAKKNGGAFILRIEDTDQARLVEGSVEHLIASLTWCGIDYDYGPGKDYDFSGNPTSYFQSERKDIYYRYARKLIADGFAYVDGNTEEEVQVLRNQAKAEGRPFLLREHRKVSSAPWEPGLPLRFLVKDVAPSTWVDATRGELHAGPEALDDFILIKSDGLPTYNLAHIVDDYEMGVTHIMRADEWIATTPKFLILYQALGITPPVFVTLPSILRAGGGKKLSKREGAQDVFLYRDEGVLPQALVNYIALLGWNPKSEQEIFSHDELIAAFDIHHINKSGAQYNDEKLLWIQREHVKLMPDEALIPSIRERAPALLDMLTDSSRATTLAHVVRDRIVTLQDINVMAENELAPLTSWTIPTRELVLGKAETADVHITSLTHAVETILTSTDSHAETYKSLLMPEADIRGRGVYLHPLRVSLSGQKNSLDPFTLLSLLPREESVRRIGEVIKMLNSAH